MNYRKVSLEIIDDGGYCSDQLFNADETGLCLEKDAQPILLYART